MREATPQAVHDAAQYVMACHLHEHAIALRQQVLPLPFLSCELCQAITGLLGLAHALTETTATPRRTRA